MLSWFASEYFAHSPVLIYPMIALLVFAGVFTAASVRALLAEKSQVERMASLPLEADDE
jgi:hypothetical protein